MEGWRGYDYDVANIDAWVVNKPKVYKTPNGKTFVLGNDGKQPIILGTAVDPDYYELEKKPKRWLWFGN